MGQICYVVNHGLDVSFHAVLEAVHWLVDGCDEERDGADVVPALNFLVREAGVPPDAQVRPLVCALGVDQRRAYLWLGVPLLERGTCATHNTIRHMSRFPERAILGQVLVARIECLFVSRI